MCVKLSLASTLDVHPCATKRPRICDYNKFLFFFVLCCLFYFYFSNTNTIYKVCGNSLITKESFLSCCCGLA